MLRHCICSNRNLRWQWRLEWLMAFVFTDKVLYRWYQLVQLCTLSYLSTTQCLLPSPWGMRLPSKSLMFASSICQAAEALTLAWQQWPRHARLAQSSLALAAMTHGYSLILRDRNSQGRKTCSTAPSLNGSLSAKWPSTIFRMSALSSSVKAPTPRKGNSKGLEQRESWMSQMMWLDNKGLFAHPAFFFQWTTETAPKSGVSEKLPSALSCSEHKSMM